MSLRRFLFSTTFIVIFMAGAARSQMNNFLSFESQFDALKAEMKRTPSPRVRPRPRLPLLHLRPPSPLQTEVLLSFRVPISILGAATVTATKMDSFSMPPTSTSQVTAIVLPMATKSSGAAIRES
ncbi:unnamed protein product [Caenorhabditis auriculariae]|uniref:Uncharacterized protein n=1 Tax=Caenorhabditis auriculariae TaxID=2777116 RepID=A0A8S1HB51_9PELO|nr:unnamed protein product [Caenorhabditis auriculariae]